jgi:hypothetical protein
VIIVATAACILFVIGMLYKDKIIHWISRIKQGPDQNP